MAVWKRATDPPLSDGIARGFDEMEVYSHSGALDANAVFSTPSDKVKGILDDDPEADDWIARGSGRQLAFVMASDQELPSITIEGSLVEDPTDVDDIYTIRELGNGDPWDTQHRYVGFVVGQLIEPYFRIKFTNGGSAATDFKCLVLLRNAGPEAVIGGHEFGRGSS